MTKIFEDQSAKIAKAADAAEKAKLAFVAASDEFDKLTEAMAEMLGYPADNTIRGLIRNWGPKIAIYFGLPAGAGVLVSAAANKGAFSGIFSLIGKVLGVGG